MQINPDGSYTYTPPTDFVGEDTVTIEVCDENGNCQQSELSIEVRDSISNPDNSTPVASDDNFETFSDPTNPVTLEGELLNNDADPNGDLLTIDTTPLVPPTNGTLTINPDGTFEYTPDAGFIGDDTFTYEVCDPSGECDTAVVTISVQPDPDPNANNSPDANDDLLTTALNTPSTGAVLTNDNDPNGDDLTVSEINGTPVAGPTTVTTPNGGMLTINPDGTYQYTPADDFVGTENIQYTIDDGNGGTDTATLVVNVVDHAPQPQDDTNVTEMNTPVDGNVLTNDLSDPMDDLVIGNGNGDPITGPTEFPTDSGGTLEINPDGTYTYTPPTDFVGEDTVTVEICDENGNCEETTLTLEVRDPAQEAGNTTPIANNDNFEVFSNSAAPAGTPILANVSVISNDGDPDENPIMIADPSGNPATEPQVITTTAGGTVTINPNGTIQYVPPTPGFIGTDTFDYTIVDSEGVTDTATVSIDVGPDPDPNTNDAPVAGDDTLVGTKNDPATVNLLANDTDPNGDPITISEIAGTPIDPVNPTTVTLPEGTLTYDPSTGETTFEPADDFTGAVQVPYTLTDGTDTDTAVLNVVVFDAPPTVQGEEFVTTADTPVDGNVLENDSDPDTDDDITVTSVNGVTPVAGTPINIFDVDDPTILVGEIVIDPATGDFTFTPEPGFRGEAFIEYEVCDEGGNCDTGVLEIPIADIATAKEQISVVPNGDNFDVTMRITVANTGATQIDDIIILDDIADRFGVTLQSVTTPTLDTSGIVSGIAPPTVNVDWLNNPSANLIVDGSSLAAGDSFTITFTTTIDPNAGGSSTPLTNQASVQGTDATTPSIVIVDLSDEGDDPAGNNDDPNVIGDEGVDDVTNVYIPDISVAKEQGDVTLDRATLNWLVDYHFVVENTGTTALSNIDIIDDVALTFGDAFVRIDAGSLTISEFTGSGTPPTANPDWETNTSLDILLGDVVLNPGDSFVVDFSVLINSANLTSDLANSATATAQGLDISGNALANGGIAADTSDSGVDPRTNNPGAPGDRGTSSDPTPLIVDLDGDFVSDQEESLTEDRDGDGISDAEDFDPAGYLYDRDTGRILQGGSISVTGPGPGSVNLIDAGADGSYQFFGIAPFSGTYIISVTAPEGYELDTAWLSRNPFDPTGQGAPVSLGAGEDRSTGFLTDPQPTLYYLSFDLEAGDPIIINNNIPFRLITDPPFGSDTFNRVGGGGVTIPTPAPLNLALMSESYQGPLRISGLYQAEFRDDLPQLGQAGAAEGADGCGEPGVDSDGDGVQDHIDIDDDNDGQMDVAEGCAADADADGTPNRLDTDSNNDGISDVESAGLGHLDSDGDGRIDPAHPVSNNGFADELETDVDSGVPVNQSTPDAEPQANSKTPAAPVPAPKFSLFASIMNLFNRA